MKEILLMIKSKEQENLLLKNMFIQVNFYKIKFMEKEQKYLQMVLNILEYGKIINQ